MDIQEAKIKSIIEIKAGEIIDVIYDKVTYEILVQDYDFIFRRKDHPMCLINFQLDYIRSDDDYDNYVYINYFECEYEGKPRRDGLKMLVRLMDFINIRAREVGIQFKYIKLIAEPYIALYNRHDQTTTRAPGGMRLSDLVQYYEKIGFKLDKPSDEDNLETLESANMTADFDKFMNMHKTILKPTKKSISKSKKSNSIKSKSKKSKSKRRRRH